jgi:hypothetical protein
MKADFFDDITLQINLSAGDVRYAELMVPMIVKQHHQIKQRLLIVDCCRPQKTKLVDPDIRYPKAKFDENVKKIVAITEKLLANGTVNNVYYIKPEDPLISHLAKKYLANFYDCTHSAGGTANMSYWAGIELVKTNYLVHYDGDMFIYQAPNYDWVIDAKKFMQAEQDAVIAVPRLCPPIKGDQSFLPSHHEGRKLIEKENYWLNDWFSTRQFLMDKRKFEKYLPLPQGKAALLLLLRKYGRRAFPIDPEILMFKSISPRHGKRLVMKSESAWLLHPTDKGDDFIRMLPQLLSAIEEGKYPAEQIGYEDMKLAAWMAYFKENDQI